MVINFLELLFVDFKFLIDYHIIALQIIPFLQVSHGASVFSRNGAERLTFLHYVGLRGGLALALAGTL